MPRPASHCGHLSRDMRIMSDLLHSRRMASASCRGQPTRPSGCGMARPASHRGPLSRDMSIMSNLLHSRRMASASCRGQPTRPSGSGMPRPASHCSHLARKIRMLSILLQFRPVERTWCLDLETSLTVHDTLAHIPCNVSYPYVSPLTRNMLLLILLHLSMKSLLPRKEKTKTNQCCQ